MVLVSLVGGVADRNIHLGTHATSSLIYSKQKQFFGVFDEFLTISFYDRMITLTNVNKKTVTEENRKNQRPWQKN